MSKEGIFSSAATDFRTAEVDLARLRVKIALLLLPISCRQRLGHTAISKTAKPWRLNRCRRLRAVETDLGTGFASFEWESYDFSVGDRLASWQSPT